MRSPFFETLIEVIGSKIHWNFSHLNLVNLKVEFCEFPNDFKCIRALYNVFHKNTHISIQNAFYIVDYDTQIRGLLILVR